LLKNKISHPIPVWPYRQQIPAGKTIHENNHQGSRRGLRCSCGTAGGVALRQAASFLSVATACPPG
jgi:hypothetical protein